LEERTLKFQLQSEDSYVCFQTISNYEDGKQIIRSSGSVGANYIEANEALSHKDFVMRLRISRKESRETLYWLYIILKSNDLTPEVRTKCESIIKESSEIRNILSAILKKSV
jgi:four helix bundle protein